jgi:multiple sugar transport system substrate-binding protein
MVLVGVSLVVPKGAEAATELTIWTPFPEVHDLVRKLAEKYMQQNPDIKITATLFPQRALEEKLAVALPAGVGPDLYEEDKHRVYPHYSQGFVEPLPTDMAAWVKQNWPEYSVKSNTAGDGKMFAFPWFLSLKAMFYNKDYFRETGITKVPTTVDELIAAAKKLTKYDAKGNVTRAGLDLRLSGGGTGIVNKFQPQAMHPYGVDVLEQVGDKYRAGYNNEGGRQALKLFIDLLYKHKVVAFDHRHDAEAFALGITSMFQRESWVVNYLAQQAPNLNYGVFPMPRGPGGWATMGNTQNLVVTKYSKAKKEAFAFAKWMLDGEQVATTFEAVGWQPFRTNIDYSSVYKKYPQLKAWVDISTLPGHKIIDWENIPAIAEIHNRLADRLTPAFKRKDLMDNPQGIAEAINQMAQGTNRILADHGLLAK